MLKQTFTCQARSSNYCKCWSKYVNEKQEVELSTNATRQVARTIANAETKIANCKNLDECYLLTSDES
jgi:hypothetical protein